jgi:hypothetical protein
VHPPDPRVGQRPGRLPDCHPLPFGRPGRDVSAGAGSHQPAQQLGPVAGLGAADLLHRAVQLLDVTGAKVDEPDMAEARPEVQLDAIRSRVPCGVVSDNRPAPSDGVAANPAFRLIASSAVIRPSRPRSASNGPSRCLVPSPPELQRSIRAVEVQRGADGRLYPVRAATPDERRRVRAPAHALVCRGGGTGSPGRGVVPGPVFFWRKDQPCSALTCWKNTLNDVPVLLSAVGNACSVPAPVPVLVAFSGLVVKNDDSVCFLPL